MIYEYLEMVYLYMLDRYLSERGESSVLYWLMLSQMFSTSVAGGQHTFC